MLAGYAKDIGGHGIGVQPGTIVSGLDHSFANVPTMPEHPTADHLGEPDLKVSGFELWVHGRQYPDSTDKFDGNWLRATAHSSSFGASVFVSGAILMVNDLVRWSGECDALAR